MRNSISATSVFLLLHVILFSVFLQSTQCSNFSTDESGNLLEEICKQTPLYDLCLSSLQSNPQSSKTDVKGLARIMADTLLANAADALNYIEGLIKQSPEPEVERSLAYCAELYIPVVKYTLPQAIDALTNGQYKFANFGISDAAKEADACEKKLSGSTKSPLSDWNNLVENLSDVAVAIVNILIEG
ncbi:Cell wall / vacuolar inhibitor of fructosidase 1 [Morella rubra]|uniref:Cell wall / vacuolar inhibitor of fructosidase 1 n=1 Tax=Morella rubra TaxID=262757 RepID=A0A6A1WJW5_9ROSI|nr:Cell wall / vacuolar inhibitor of fructosidase 1 [Morella rubra]